MRDVLKWVSGSSLPPRPPASASRCCRSSIAGAGSKGAAAARAGALRQRSRRISRARRRVGTLVRNAQPPARDRAALAARALPPRICAPWSRRSTNATRTRRSTCTSPNKPPKSTRRSRHMGRRPVEWLVEHVPLSPRWCLIHTTHMTAAEIDALAAYRRGCRHLPDDRGKSRRRNFLAGGVAGGRRRDRDRVGQPRQRRRRRGTALARIRVAASRPAANDRAVAAAPLRRRRARRRPCARAADRHAGGRDRAPISSCSMPNEPALPAATSRRCSIATSSPGDGAPRATSTRAACESSKRVATTGATRSRGATRHDGGETRRTRRSEGFHAEDRSMARCRRALVWFCSL